jgi:hypothetical protein
MTKARDLANFISVSVDGTELGYLDGVTSDLQTQLNDRYQVANTNTIVNDRMQVANTTLLVNDRVQVANLTSTLTSYATFAGDNSWTGSQRATNVTDNDGSFDMNAGQNFICTPTGNFALTFTNIANGQTGFIKLVNTGGHTVSLAATSKADAKLTATVTTAGTYILSYYSDGTNVYLTNSAAIA